MGAGLMLLVTRADVRDVLSEVEWPARVFFIGLHRISFWMFTRYGIIVPAGSTILAWTYVWLRYFL